MRMEKEKYRIQEKKKKKGQISSKQVQNQSNFMVGWPRTTLIGPQAETPQVDLEIKSLAVQQKE